MTDEQHVAAEPPQDGAATSEPDPDPAAGDPRAASEATVVDAEGAGPGQADAPPRGVTLPVAVPVTAALVLGLAVGLILGWVIPRPGAGDDGGTVVAADGSGETDGDVAAGTEGDEAATSGGTAAELSPAVPASVEGGPDGTAEVAGLLIGEQGPLVEVFEDYVCPFCARLELSAGAQLREAALSGEYRLVVHPIAFLTDDSPRAANASACVYQHENLDTWVAFHEAVYERQDPSESVGQYTNEILVDVAGEAGASSQATTSCIEGGDFEPWVAAITQQAFERGVRGTPTVAVDGTLTDVAPLVQ
jgi:protein-disulfide isomerase